jgi:cbb3-type cytochrome oxidase maturation protein
MGVVLILLAASLSIAAGFLAAFIWSVKSGQYDDDYTPSIRMLFDDKAAGHQGEDRNTLKEKNEISAS